MDILSSVGLVTLVETLTKTCNEITLFVTQNKIATRLLYLFDLKVTPSSETNVVLDCTVLYS